jgi:hypothetical protein
MWDEYGLFANETTATLPRSPVVEAQEKMGQLCQGLVR